MQLDKVDPLVTLSDKKTELLNFSSGLPFYERPNPSDPDAGIKLAFNMRYAYLGDNGYIPEMKMAPYGLDERNVGLRYGILHEINEIPI